MKNEIILIAEAILANTRVLQSLVDKLPDESKKAIAAIIEPVAVPVASPTTVATPSVAPVVVPVVPVAPPVVATPVPVAQPVAVVVPATDCPIITGKEMSDFLMSSFKANPTLGPKLQAVLNSVGVAAVNELKPEQFAAVYAAVKAL